MKKSRKNRRRIDKLTTRAIIDCQYFATTCRKCNAKKIELEARRDNKVVASVVVIDDAPHKQTVIRWYDHRYYALRYGAKEAKPYKMTLAEWKTINGTLS